MQSKLLIYLVILVAVILAAGGWWIFRGGEDKEVPLRSATQSFEGHALDLAFQNYNGDTVRLSDFETPLVINAWAVWCPFCVKELPDFAAVQQEFGNRVAIIAVDRAESREVAKEFTDGLGISNDLVFLLDPSDSFYRAIGGFSMPETLFVKADGTIHFHKRGPMTREEIRQRTQELVQ